MIARWVVKLCAACARLYTVQDTVKHCPICGFRLYP